MPVAAACTFDGLSQGVAHSSPFRSSISRHRPDSEVPRGAAPGAYAPFGSLAAVRLKCAIPIAERLGPAGSFFGNVCTPHGTRDSSRKRPVHFGAQTMGKRMSCAAQINASKSPVADPCGGSDDGPLNVQERTLPQSLPANSPAAGRAAGR